MELRGTVRIDAPLLVVALSEEADAFDDALPVLVTGPGKVNAATSVAAALTFYDVDGRRDNITSRNIVGEPATMFEYWFDDASGGDRPVLLVDFERKDLEDSRIDAALVSVGPIQEQTISWRGQVIRHLYYRIAAGYRPDAVRRFQVVP